MSTRKPNIIEEDLKIVRGGRLLLRPSTHTHSQVLPAAQVGRGNLQSLGCWAGSQGRQFIGRQSVGRQTGGRRVTTVYVGVQKTKQQADGGKTIGGEREQVREREGEVPGEILEGTHPHPQVLPASQVGRGKSSRIGMLVRQPGAARHRPEVIREADGRTAGDHCLWRWLEN